MRLMDLTHQKFGKLLVLKRNENKDRVYWDCRCDCGIVISVLADSLRRKATTSCGCSRRRTKEEQSLKKRLSHVFRRYGLSESEYLALLEAQNYKCAICSEKLTIVAVDHCHTTGKVRGLLCKECNSALGLMGDSVELLKKGAEYLEKFEAGLAI